MDNRQKVKNISKISKSITDTIESTSFGLSTIAALIAMSWSAMDYMNDGVLDVLYAHPKIYTASLAAPFITGYLITKLDNNSDTAANVRRLIDDVKPKSRTRKK